jgi:hypothetical protein
LQQLLQLLPELLQFPSVLQNADADRAAAIVGDSLSPRAREGFSGGPEPLD